MIGHLNAQHQSWGSLFNNQRGRYLKNTLDYFSNFAILNDKRITRIALNNSCLDHALCSVDVLHRISWDVDSDNYNGSDHFPIYVFCEDFKKLQFCSSRIYNFLKLIRVYLRKNLLTYLLYYRFYFLMRM